MSASPSIGIPSTLSGVDWMDGESGAELEALVPSEQNSFSASDTYLDAGRFQTLGGLTKSSAELFSGDSEPPLLLSKNQHADVISDAVEDNRCVDFDWSGEIRRDDNSDDRFILSGTMRNLKFADSKPLIASVGKSFVSLLKSDSLGTTVGTDQLIPIDVWNLRPLEHVDGLLQGHFGNAPVKAENLIGEKLSRAAVDINMAVELSKPVDISMISTDTPLKVGGKGAVCEFRVVNKKAVAETGDARKE